MMIFKCLLALMLISSVAYADDPTPEEVPCVKDDPRPRCLFEFEEDGQVHTKDPRAERTFKFPPLKAGFIFDVNHKAILPHIGIQIVDWDMFGETFNTNFGVSWMRTFVDFSWEIVPIMKIGPSIWAGYNVEENDWAAGIGFNILKF